MRADDRMYDCLPLCHSVGGVAALAAALVNGGSVVIAEKFSASRFWSDVARWDCTIFQYIGELCRYLVAAPPSAGGEGASAAARLRQRAFRRRVARLRRAFRRAADPRVLRLHRRQPDALQRRGQGRRDRPPAAVPRRARRHRAGALRLRDGSAAARAGRLLRALRRRRGRRGAGPHRPRGRPALRGLHRAGGDGEEDPARRLRARRRLDAHRRSDAPRPRGLLLFRRPRRRHVPLEGRERRRRAKSPPRFGRARRARSGRLRRRRRPTPTARRAWRR